MSILTDVDMCHIRTKAHNGSWSPAHGNVATLDQVTDHIVDGWLLSASGTLQVTVKMEGTLTLWTATTGATDGVDLVEVYKALDAKLDVEGEGNFHHDTSWPVPDGYIYGKSAVKPTGLWYATFRGKHVLWLTEVDDDAFDSNITDGLFPYPINLTKFFTENAEPQHGNLYLICPATGYPVDLMRLQSILHSNKAQADWAMEVQDQLKHFTVKSLSLK